MTHDVTQHAGRELDALVAERVMGLGFFHNADVTPEHTELRIYACGVERPMVQRLYADGSEMVSEPLDFPRLPHYSTDIRAAWKVVEKLNESERWPTIQYGPTEGGEDTLWFVQLVNPADVEVTAETAPLAICRAALAAVRAVGALPTSNTEPES